MQMIYIDLYGRDSMNDSFPSCDSPDYQKIYRKHEGVELQCWRQWVGVSMCMAGITVRLQGA